MRNHLMHIGVILLVLAGIVIVRPGLATGGPDALMMPVEDGVWRQVDPGGSGGTLDFAMHPVSGTLLVSSDMGRSLLRSTDGGRTYTPIAPDGHPTMDVLVPHPSTSGAWYAGFSSIQGRGLFISRDDGSHWDLVRKDKDIAGKTVAGLVMDGQPQDILVWIVKDKGLFISRDGGRHFTPFSQGLPPGVLPGPKKNLSARMPLVAVPDRTAPLMFLATRSGLFRRRLQDPAWAKVPGGPDTAVTTLAHDRPGNRLWAGTGHNEIHVLDLLTGTWRQIPSPAGLVTLLKTHPGKPDWLWCFSHGRDGLFRTRDQGKTWEWLTRRRLAHTRSYQGNVPRDFRHRYKFQRDYVFIHPQNPEHILLGDMYLSLDGGITWQFSAMNRYPDTFGWQGKGLALLTSYRAFWDNINPNRVYLGFSDTGLMQSRDRGNTVLSLWSSQYPDLYPLAYWSRQMITSSGSCMAFAPDPDFPSTQFYGMSGKGGKNSVSGMLFKTHTSGAQWSPVLPETSGLPNGIIPDMDIFPGLGFDKRELFVVVNSLEHGKFPKAGIYHSEDSGRSFRVLADTANSPLHFPLMNLDHCRDHPDIFYAAASSEGGKRPANTLKKTAKSNLGSGGIFKSSDRGRTWSRAGGPELSGAVQVAAHPTNPDTAYAAVVQGKAASKAEAFFKQGGIYRTTNGGGDWELVLGREQIPDPARKASGLVPSSVAINPAFPDIVYAAIDRAGVFRTLDGGRSWAAVDWERLKKFQGTYHTLSINPHDPAEFYLALFGNAFLAYRDPVAARAMAEVPPSLVLNGGFENTMSGGRPVHWTWNNLNLPGPDGKPVLSIAGAPDRKGRALHIKLTGDGFTHPEFTGSKKGPITFLAHRLSPYSMSRIRGKQVVLGYDVYARRLSSPDTPVLSVTETGALPARLIAELPAHLAFGSGPGKSSTIRKAHPMAGKWVRATTTFSVSPRAKSIVLTLLASEKSNAADLYIDNITLDLAGASHE